MTSDPGGDVGHSRVTGFWVRSFVVRQTGLTRSRREVRGVRSVGADTGERLGCEGMSDVADTFTRDGALVGHL